MPGTFSFSIPRCDPARLKATLYDYDRFHIEVPVTLHRDRFFLRPSLQAYNTRADADALVLALGCLLSEAGSPFSDTTAP
jgi:selenocysteine lyase/cysteine desulfurase